ncbi:hypothetical protein HDV57DRAFT_13935 [Trichoderma longibrachiatum]|uniref:Uncharacterized protein n=1 Tax=Trichoderma longibrachiatum ATCC 18648 TaxID=983965 RepID=A0A2T4CJ48_TRILO|nr:hypothetical protein M440DRAFT_88171 [Trichoderma longibrachiatum ATCC 18648]
MYMYPVPEASLCRNDWRWSTTSGAHRFCASRSSWFARNRLIEAINLSLSRRTNTPKHPIANRVAPSLCESLFLSLSLLKPSLFACPAASDVGPPLNPLRAKTPQKVQRWGPGCLNRERIPETNALTLLQPQTEWEWGSASQASTCSIAGAVA